jgi:hypothetical protein
MEHDWSANPPGRLVIACKVDNMLRDYIRGSEFYLEERVTVAVAASAPGRIPLRASDLPARGPVAPQNARRSASPPMRTSTRCGR